VEGYTCAVRGRVTVDWQSVPTILLDPGRIPPEVEMKAALPSNQGRPTLSGPGRLEDVTLNPYRRDKRRQQLVFDLARALTRDLIAQSGCEVPAHILFAQLVSIVDRYLREKVRPVAPANVIDVFLSPYYGWVIETLRESIRPEVSQGEPPELPRYETHRGPGSTAEADFWTSREVREVVKCHLNYVVADTRRWEQSAAYRLDRNQHVAAFVKNAGLGFAIPYVHNGQTHDYVPDFIARLKTDSPDRARYLVLEVKGFDPLEQVKGAAAKRWVAAVNADGRYGQWSYHIARKPEAVERCIEEARRQ